jgi:hypothetical protein
MSETDPYCYILTFTTVLERLFCLQLQHPLVYQLNAPHLVNLDAPTAFVCLHKLRVRPHGVQCMIFGVMDTSTVKMPVMNVTVTVSNKTKWCFHLFGLVFYVCFP